MKRAGLTLVRAAVTLALGLCVAFGFASPAQAAFGLNSFDIAFTAPPANPADLEHADAPLGPTVEQAGAHPFAMTTSFGVDGKATSEGGFEADEAVKDAIFTIMQGFAGAPTAVPTCSNADFAVEATNTRPDCPDSAVIGLVANELASKNSLVSGYSPVYNLNPPPGTAAEFGFWFASVPVTVSARLSEESPNPIVSAAENISQQVEVAGSRFTLWGVPADPRHDSLRGGCLGPEGESLGKCNVSKSIAETPFLTLPRACEGPLGSSYFARSWRGSVASGSTLTHDEGGNPKGMTGCGALGFKPEITAQPTARSAASASGMDVSLHFSDEGLTNPDGIAGSDLRKAVVTFPEGVTLNPSQAEGLATCSPGQVARETASSAFGEGCPAESKVGSVEVESPLLPEKVFKGSLFVATPYENPFGSLIAVYMTIKEPERGIGITLAGKVEPDPATGQLVTTFGEPQSPIPQDPISNFRVHLIEGGRSPLVTPDRCGSYRTEMLLTPTADPGNPRTATASFHIGSGPGGGPCPAAGPLPFEPGLEAGTLANGAATHSPFLMRLTRRDGDQDLTKFAATLPPGVLASLVGVAKCSDSSIAAARARTGPHGGAEELASPSCPAGSKIGTTLAGAGVGSELTYVPGSLYLAGPYHGAPLSVVSITPGLAGPFDVGTVVVRVALEFNPRTGEATADGARSDPIPHILRGIPLVVRDLRVNVDRQNWIFNPTSCRESSTRARIFGSGADFFNPADDVSVARSARFQAAGCKELGFAPRLALKLKGKTRRGEFPALTATYRPRKGDANLRGLSLLFPRSEFIENAHFRTICTRVQFAAKSCPKASVYGHVVVTTPLLEEPLKGPVYLRSSNHLLPDAVLALHGIIDVEVPVKIDSHHKRLRATITAAPDAPVTKAVVRMQGGQKGLFVNSRNLCAGKNRTRAGLTAQSGKALKRKPVLKALGCRARHRHGHRR